jgi:hypothetical protein
MALELVACSPLNNAAPRNAAEVLRKRYGRIEQVGQVRAVVELNKSGRGEGGGIEQVGKGASG